MNFSLIPPHELSLIGAPIVRSIAYLADQVPDQVRPEVSDDSTVGEVIAIVYNMMKAPRNCDSERLILLEALVTSLATLIYREHKEAFDRFVDESAEMVVLNAMKAMRDQSPTND